MNSTKDTIEKAILYIENHVKHSIKLDDVSNHCNVSKYHLHRLFKSLTGMNIMDYAMARKLSSSVELLMNSDFRIIDVANAYGFEYEQNYIRAFKRIFNQTPSKARCARQGISVVEKISMDDIASIGNALVYRPQFVIRPAFYIAGIRHKIYATDNLTKANALGKSFFYEEKNVIHPVIDPEIYIGYTDWSTNACGYNTYMPAVMIPRIYACPKEISCQFVPSHKYAVFRFVGHFRPENITGHHLLPLLDYLYEKWIYNAGYIIADPFRFEYVDQRISREDYCELDIYQPVKKR